MASQNPAPYDILLIGKTGLGKSTTGNYLIESQDASQIIADELFDARMEWLLGNRRRLTEFKSAQSKDSCTKRPEVLRNQRTNIRVMDTKGFADTDLSKGTSFTSNLCVMRSIVTWQDQAKMSFRRILYFLPSRTPLERMDGHLQEEIQLMLHFFGPEVFTRMVLVFTISPDLKSDLIVHQIFEGWRETTEETMLYAIKVTAERLDIDMPENFKCPPVVYLPRIGPSPKVISIVKETKVVDDSPYNMELRETTCVKCAGSLMFPVLGKSTGDPVSVKYDNNKPVLFADSTCHPAIVPKYSRLRKIGGGLAHIFTLGGLRLFERIKEKDYQPFFGNSKEVCVACKNPTEASRGCEKANTKWSKSKLLPILVSHQCGLKG